MSAEKEVSAVRVTKVKPSKAAIAVVAARRAPQPPVKAVTAKAVVAKAVAAKAVNAQSAAKPQRSVPLVVSERPAVKRGTPAPVASKPIAAKPTGTATTFTLDAQVGYLIRRAHQRACSIFADAMTRFDLTPTQFAALARIDEMGPMSQSQLERQTALEPGELLNVVGRLHRRGLIRPRPSPLDHRLIQLELTADSLAIIADVKATASKVAAKTLAPLSPEDAETLKTLLERIG